MSAYETAELAEDTHRFADRLRGLMREARLNACDVALRIECSPSMVSLMTRGKRRPSLGTLIRLAQLFDTTAADLWGG